MPRGAQSSNPLTSIVVQRQTEGGGISTYLPGQGSRHGGIRFEIEYAIVSANDACK